MELAAAAAAAGASLQIFDTVGSTNAEALAAARSGTRGPLWVVAQAQTGGRGRRGRAWTSAPGNLYASLLLTDPAPPEHVAQLSFVAALAVRDAIVACAPTLAPAVRLKWPNDVLCNGKKLAGILLEGVAGTPFAVVIGIGVNCRHHPDGNEFPATDLAAEGAQVSPAELLSALSAAMADRVRQWERGDGLAGIRADWLGQAAGIGTVIRVRLEQRELIGRFEALDRDGRLLLKTEDGAIETIAAGDVFPVGSPAKAARSAGSQ